MVRKVIETETRRIIKRLEQEGWTNIGGGRHDCFVRNGEIVVVPRHRQVSPGVARSIAKAAGWI
jgi:predicted RNA binding protein YcfA (HicA-like mRNA interferase family)